LGAVFFSFILPTMFLQNHYLCPFNKRF